MKQFPAIAQTFILTSFSALSLFAAPVQAASFRGLGFLDPSKPSVYSYATGVSADGSVVVGTSRSSNGYDEAFRWTQVGGMFGLGFIAGNNLYSYASSVSADGSVVVGQGRILNGYEAFRCTQETGMVGLGFIDFGISHNSDFLGSGNSNSNATGVSADGSIIVGIGSNDNGDSEAFRWTQESGIGRLGFLPVSSCLLPHYSSCNSYDPKSSAYGISADGSVIVGTSSIVDANVPSLWTNVWEIRALNESGSNGYANGVSANGSVIVGAINNKAFRWTQSSGMVLLEDHVNPDGISNTTGV